MKTKKLLFTAVGLVSATIISCGFIKGPLSSEEVKYRDNLIRFRPWNLTILISEKDAEDDSGDVAEAVCERLSRLGVRYSQKFPACFMSGDIYLTVSQCSKMDGVSLRIAKEIERFRETNPGIRCVDTRTAFETIDSNIPDLELGKTNSNDLKRKFGTPNGRGEGRYTYNLGVHERVHCVGERWYGADYVFRMELGGIVEAIEIDIPGRGC